MHLLAETSVWTWARKNELPHLAGRAGTVGLGNSRKTIRVSFEAPEKGPGLLCSQQCGAALLDSQAHKWSCQLSNESGWGGEALTHSRHVPLLFFHLGHMTHPSYGTACDNNIGIEPPPPPRDKSPSQG